MSSDSSSSGSKYSMSDIEVTKSVSLSINKDGGQKEVTNGGSDHQWSQLTSGVMTGLTMAQLNNLLGNYIKTVREMEDKVSNITLLPSVN